MAPSGLKQRQEESSEPAKGRGGRPSREASEALREHILTIATELLLTDGYGATSIEEVARRARISKRTFYHRFQDKPALMRAVVARFVDGLRPPADVPLIEGANLEEILVHLGSVILNAALTPAALKLHSLVVGEAQRFPDLATAIAQAGGRQEAINLISGALMHHAKNGRPAPEDAIFAAEQFLQMVLSSPQARAIGLGKPMDKSEQDRWLRQTVALFLYGFDRPARGI